MEVLFSRAGQTADDLIERAAHRFQEYGEVLVVTDDYAERNMVSGLRRLGGELREFHPHDWSALTELQDELRNHNRAERNRFNRPQKNKGHEDVFKYISPGRAGSRVLGAGCFWFPSRRAAGREQRAKPFSVHLRHVVGDEVARAGDAIR